MGLAGGPGGPGAEPVLCLTHGTCSGRTDYGLFCGTSGQKPRAPECHLPPGDELFRGAKCLALQHELPWRVPQRVPTLRIRSQEELAPSHLLARVEIFLPLVPFIICLHAVRGDSTEAGSTLPEASYRGLGLLAMRGCPLPGGTFLAAGSPLPGMSGRCCILFCPPGWMVAKHPPSMARTEGSHCLWVGKALWC